MVRPYFRSLLHLCKKQLSHKTDTSNSLNAYQRWNYIPKDLEYFDLSADEWKQFYSALSDIKSGRSRVEEVSGGSTLGEFLILNEKGSRPPIFWCFNNWAEPLLLTRKLGADQPLIAMHSLNSIVKGLRTKKRFLEHLASRYLETIKPMYGDGHLILGGNCQGSPIVEAIAIQAQKTLNTKPLLITLDYIPQRMHQLPMLLLFGRDSAYNPFNTDVDPLPILRSNHSNFAWGFIGSIHGQYFKNPEIDQLGWMITKAIGSFTATGSLPQEELLLTGNHAVQ